MNTSTIARNTTHGRSQVGLNRVILNGDGRSWLDISG